LDGAVREERAHVGCGYHLGFNVGFSRFPFNKRRLLGRRDLLPVATRKLKRPTHFKWG
jgi:hypothetical protein